jgi:hypothetical protein
VTRLNPSRAVTRRLTPPTRRSPRLATAHFFGFDDVIGIIWSGIKWVAEKAAIIAEAVWKAVKLAASYTWDGLKWFGGKVKDGVLWLKDRLVDFGKWWKEKAGPWLQKTFTNIHDWFQRHFGWLTKWVKWAQKNLGWVYTHVLRPFLHFVDITRTVLRLLADLGVKWATTLERWLAGVELKVLGLWGDLVGFVNEIAGIVDLLYNPAGFFRRNVFLWSHWHMAGDIAAVARLARIDRNPYTEGSGLIGGLPGLDNRSQAQVIVSDLESPPPEIQAARIELERELGLG